MWSEGEVVVRREVLNDGRVWAEIPVIVVRDTPDLLATYIAEGAPLRFPAGRWPTADGLHPWHGKSTWSGHGTLMLQRPDDMHAIWHFWKGDEREFAGCYINLQEPFRRADDGYDTQDLELDLWLPRHGPLEWKDEDLLEQRAHEGRFTPKQAANVRAEAARIATEVETGCRWWDDFWVEWQPESGWAAPAFPDGR